MPAASNQKKKKKKNRTIYLRSKAKVGPETAAVIWGVSDKGTRRRVFKVERDPKMPLRAITARKLSKI